MMNSRKKAVILTVVGIVVTNMLTFFAANTFSFAIGNKAIITRNDYELLKKFRKLFLVKGILEDKYVDPFEEEDLVEGAIRGMVDGIGDPYTVYWDPQEYEANNIQTQGEYTGIGLYVTSVDNKVVIIAPIEDTPAERAGLKSGDIIIMVDGKETSGDNLEEAVAMMRGKAGTKVKITIAREGLNTPFEVEIKREKVVLKTVKSEMLKDSVGYIRITTFDAHTAESFKKALDDLKQKGMEGLVLDLRDNPGGLLDQCAEIADELIGKGTIVYTIDNKGVREDIMSDENKIGVPLVILVNGGTASASEIVSGAVKDTKSGILVGTKTFGKGLVQTIVPIASDKSAVKVTIARYYTPSGVCIQGTGIEPDVTIEIPDELSQKGELTRQEDIQLSKALEILRSQMN